MWIFTKFLSDSVFGKCRSMQTEISSSSSCVNKVSHDVILYCKRINAVGFENIKNARLY